MLVDQHGVMVPLDEATERCPNARNKVLTLLALLVIYICVCMYDEATARCPNARKVLTFS